MPKIALIKVDIHYSSYDDSYDILNSISEWEEVTKEELKLLKDYFGRNYKDKQIIVIEFVENQRETINLAVKAQLEYIKKEEEKRLAEKKAKEEKTLARKLKSDQKKLEDKKKLLEQLKKEFGE